MATNLRQELETENRNGHKRAGHQENPETQLTLVALGLEAKFREFTGGNWNPPTLCSEDSWLDTCGGRASDLKRIDGAVPENTGDFVQRREAFLSEARIS
jgi:hypothetical protein